MELPPCPVVDAWERLDLPEGVSAVLVEDCGLLGKDVEGRADIELVYVFARAAWGRGYATEIGRALMQFAFERRQVPRLIAMVDPANAASARVAVKLGMRREAAVIRPGGARREVYAIAAPSHRGLSPQMR